MTKVGSTVMTNVTASAIVRTWLILGCWVLVVGCKESEPKSSPSVATSAPSSAGSDSPAATKRTPVKEQWARILLGGKHAGYRRLVIRLGEKPETVQYEMTQVLRVTRGKDTIEQTLAQSSLETSDGAWLSAESKLSDGRLTSIDTIQVKGKVLDIEHSWGGKTSRRAMPWKPENIGFFGAEASLRSKPIAPGERREFRMLIPMFNEIGNVVISAKDWTEVTIDGAKHKAIEVEQEEKIHSTSTRSTLWLDETGEMLASETPTLNMRIERSTQSVAEAVPAGEGYDLLSATLVPIKVPLGNTRKLEQQAYRVTLKTDDPSKVFAARAYQVVKPIDNHSAEITVSKASTSSGTSGAASERIDLASSLLIDSDAPLIAQFASSTAPEEMDGVALALALEKFAHDYIETKDYAAAFDSASAVAKTKSGDCTEHAVFLAALCRARGIPARCASGLIYVPSKQAFGFHMWTLAYVKGRWLPLDVTLGVGGATVGHLQLADSSLSSGLDADLFLPVMSVLGQLTIEAIEP